jgi:hypothetical protein
METEMETVDDNMVEEHESLNVMVKAFLVQYCPIFEQLSILKERVSRIPLLLNSIRKKADVI